jgi:7-carboxy-7-deazaguanine synthase
MVSLRVVEIFDSLQGEGYWTGIPMTFVRLAGCNAPQLGLGCARWCDTPGSWTLEDGEELDVGEIVREVRLPRLCLTGGEPLLQVDGVMELVARAQDRGIRVHVETNGTVDPWRIIGSPEIPRESKDAHPGFDWATVSPKPPDFVIAPGWGGLVDELKLIVDEHLDAATAERLAASHPEAVISIQPECRKGPGAGAGKKAVERAIALVMDHPEWRLSLQTHKLLGIR